MRVKHPQKLWNGLDGWQHICHLSKLTQNTRKSLIMLADSSSPMAMKSAQDIRTDLIKFQGKSLKSPCTVSPM